MCACFPGKLWHGNTVCLEMPENGILVKTTRGKVEEINFFSKRAFRSKSLITELYQVFLLFSTNGMYKYSVCIQVFLLLNQRLFQGTTFFSIYIFSQIIWNKKCSNFVFSYLWQIGHSWKKEQKKENLWRQTFT